MTIDELANTTWAGPGELWLDRAQNEAILCDCTITIGAGEVTYTWSYEGKPQQGRLALRADGADFSDTWHSPTPMPCAPTLTRPWALVDVIGTYSAGDSPPWGWRILVSRRPDAELVLQMTNITPWGEEARAVRMIGKRT